jgi:hypothetical protein
MPGMVEPGDVVRVTAKMSILGTDIRNVYHAQYAGSEGVEDVYFVADTADRLDDAYDYIYHMHSTSMSYDTIEFFNITQDRPMDEVVWPTMTAGNSSADLTALQTAPLVVFGTDAPRSSGRKYLPPVVVDVMEPAGEIAGATLATIASYAAEILTDWFFTNGSAQFGAWSKKYSRFAPYVVGVVDELIRTQRRRVTNVGS